MQIDSTALSDVGLQRDHNEDACLADDVNGLYIVADGMGGAAAGEVASAIAIERVSSFFRPRLAELRTGEMQEPAFRQRLARLADAAIQDACQHVYQAAVQDGAKAGMGTTLTILVLLERLAIVGHVGDSRMYLKRNDTLFPLTTDHSFVNEMVHKGALTEEEALKHPMANLLTRAVGPQAGVQSDVNVFDVYNGDTFFLCSDGVSKGVSEQTLLQTLTATQSLATSAEQIINAANDAGGDDNATVVLARVTDNVSVDISAAHEAAVDDKVRALRDLPLFAGLQPTELAAVVSLAGAMELNAGDVIVNAGDFSSRFFVVARGRVMLSLHGAEVLERQQGTHFGDVECFAGTPAMLASTAMTPSLVLTFERAHLEDVCRRNPALGVQLLWRFTIAGATRVDEVLRRGTLTEE